MNPGRSESTSQRWALKLSQAMGPIMAVEERHSKPTQAGQLSWGTWAIWRLLLWPWQPSLQLRHTCYPSQGHFHPAKELGISANSDSSKMAPLQVVPQLFRWENLSLFFLAVLQVWKKKKRREEHFKNDTNGTSCYLSETQINFNLSIHVFVLSFIQSIFLSIQSIYIKSGTKSMLLLKFKKNKAFTPPRAMIC